MTVPVDHAQTASPAPANPRETSPRSSGTSTAGVADTPET
jgi:hypothetical protein